MRTLQLQVHIYVEAKGSHILVTIMTQESLQSKLYHMDLKAIYLDKKYPIETPKLPYYRR